ARIGPRSCPRAANRLSDLAHDFDTPIPVLLGIDLGRPHVLVPQDNPRGLQAESLADLGPRRMAQLVRVPPGKAGLLALGLDRLAVAGDRVADTRDPPRPRLRSVTLARLDPGLAASPALGPALLHRLRRAEQVGLPVGPQPGPQELLGLR